ncbi:MAG: ribosome small subunit-dependent GTPase A [Gammaproteobacteria bacterium]|nr:ribosome small subunit-dependent GTPase A [Gammaproteobacteria bacterium]
MNSVDSLESLGWRPFFQSQLDVGCNWTPARVLSVHRSHIEIACAAGQMTIPVSGKAARLDVTVGDWVTVDLVGPVLRQRLERLGVFQRKAAGTAGEIQLIAANVDILFIVTSANRDFNVGRLERYLAIAHDASAFPVVVITKADTVDSVEEFVADAGKLSPSLLIEAIDARNTDSVKVLRPWCESGQTVALLGSSGVGKSTLINTLAGADLATRAAREDDQRGRHTTTGRSMHRLPQGGWLIDTPGMRELQLVDVGTALNDVFADIVELATRCRFSDCSHEAEPDCAVRLAIADGDIDADRLRRFRKLQSEDRRNTETMAERRLRDRNLGKMYKSILSEQRRDKGGRN